MGFLDDAENFAVDVGCRIGGTGKGSIASQISVVYGFQSHHVIVIAHAVSGNHGSGQPGGLLNVIGGACGDGIADNFFCGPSAGVGHYPVEQVFLA